MREFPKLEKMLPIVEEAEAIFERQTMETIDDAVVTRATAAFNLVLKQAALALLSDLKDKAQIAQYVGEWSPKSDVETWFGAEPMTFLRRIVRDQEIQPLGPPRASVVH
jgi:hypothetical protein